MSKIGTANTYEVRIDEEMCNVYVVKSGDVVWKAYGSFRGMHIEQSGSSESSALSHWRRIAEFEASA
ncbi:MAG: hypothetical protein ACRETC_08205 [Gammaproteobacteria bacterium]